jgi:hypothetical protein
MIDSTLRVFDLASDAEQLTGEIYNGSPVYTRRYTVNYTGSSLSGSFALPQAEAKVICIDMARSCLDCSSTGGGNYYPRIYPLVSIPAGIAGSGACNLAAYIGDDGSSSGSVLLRYSVFGNGYSGKLIIWTKYIK